MGWPETIALFAIHLTAAGRAAGTRELRRYHLHTLADAVNAGPLSVETDQLAAWLAREDWTPNTRRSHRATLAVFFGWLQHTGHRIDNPAALLETVAGVIGKPRPCPESALRVAVATAPERERLMIALAAGAGLRRAEIAKVRAEDVEHAIGGYMLRVVGKGNRVRLVPISDEMAEAIGRRGRWAFPNPNGGPLTPAHVGKCISRLLPPGWTAHTLRHRFASAAYSADRDIRAVQELLGHASVATTQIYTAIPDDAPRRAAAAAAVHVA